MFTLYKIVKLQKDFVHTEDYACSEKEAIQKISNLYKRDKQYLRTGAIWPYSYEYWEV